MELSTQEIVDLVQYAREQGIEIDLPSSKGGVKKRAESKNWASRTVKGKGGRNGVKTLYTLPDEVVHELKEKGLLHLPETDPADTQAAPTSDLPESMLAAFSQYTRWAAEQDRSRIIPVRYYSQVFASAGNGNIVWDTDCDVMWFRSSFFKHLQTDPAHCFCTRIQGDSMFPTLLDRGTVLWQATARFTGEGVYLFRQYDEIRAKRLVRLSNDRYQIISDNPNKSIYPTVELDLTQFEPHEFELYGKYLWGAGITG